MRFDENLGCFQPSEPETPEFVLVLSERRMVDLLEALRSDTEIADHLWSWWEHDGMDGSGTGWYAATDPRGAREYVEQKAREIPVPDGESLGFGGVDA